jgi:hypothetical protein
MTDLFNRDLSLKLGELEINIQLPDPLLPTRPKPALRVTFDVEKNTNRDPNRALITIYNLSETNRATLQKGSDLITAFKKQKKLYEWQVTISSGYVETKEQLFLGDILFADSRREGSNWVTTIEAGDEERNYNSRYVSKSFGPGTSLYSVLTFLVTELGIGYGDSFNKLTNPLRKLVVFKKGVVVEGKVSKLLDKYVSGAGYQWSIQDGLLQILAPNETTLETVYVLNSASGLIGSPEKGEEGTVKAVSLLQGGIRPGRRIKLDSRMVKGVFKIERVIHHGDTWGKDWYTEVEAKPI